MAFIVRLVHVSSASLLFGGALLIFILLYLSKRKPGDPGWPVVQDVMRIYEWAAWISLALIVATGVGNLGPGGGLWSRAPGLLESSSTWRSV